MKKKPREYGYLVECRGCKTEQILVVKEPLHIYGHDPKDQSVRAPCTKKGCLSSFATIVGQFDPKKKIHIRRPTSKVKKAALDEMVAAASSLYWYFGHAGKVDRNDQPALNFHRAMSRYLASTQHNQHPDDSQTDWAWSQHLKRRSTEGD